MPLPWTVADVDGHIKGLGARQKRVWVRVANNALSRCIAAGGTDETCAPKAIRQANAAAKGVKESVDLQEVQGALVMLLEVGRAVSAANEEKIKAAIAALQAIIAKLQSGDETTEADRSSLDQARDLLEAEFSHDDIRQRLKQALKAEKENYWYYIQDCFDSYLVYEEEQKRSGEFPDYSGKKLLKRTYVIDDKGKVTMGEPVEVVAKKVYEPVKESGEQLLEGDFIPLIEKAVRRDGTVPLKLIQPGWGTSGYYSKEVLEKDGPKVFTKGLKMYWDHPTITEEAERPERSLRDLAAELVSDAKYLESGPAGPGLYADAKVFGTYKESVEELAPHIGVSIRGLGKAKMGEAEGKKGPVIESIAKAKSVDFVTSPGAGGQILQLFEAARKNIPTITLQEIKRHYPGIVEELRTEIKRSVYGEKTHLEEAVKVKEEEIRDLQEAKRRAEEENARLKEAILFREAKDFVAESLAKVDIPDLTRARLVESLSKDPVLKEGTLELDKEKFAAAVTEAVKAEIDYLASVTGAGQIRGMGPGAGNAGSVNLEEVQKNLESSFSALGLTESQAKIAAKGREV